jgi:hypothetical protein
MWSVVHHSSSLSPAKTESCYLKALA